MSEPIPSTQRVREAAGDVLPVDEPVRFDESLWPANTVLVVLGLIVAGLIIAYGDFHTEGVAASAERLAASAWFQLGALVLLVLLLLLNASRDSSRMRVRRLQFSACVGLLIHVGMLTSLHHSDFFFESPIKTKPLSKRRPFEIVSLPSDGRRLAQTLAERGYSGSIETSNQNEVNAIERIAMPVDEVSSDERSQAEPESFATEVTPAELSRAEASASRLGQLTTPQLERQLSAGPLPESEAMNEPLAPIESGAAPVIDAETGVERPRTQAEVTERGAIGFSPDAPEPTLPLLGPDLRARPRGQPAATNTPLTRAPERAPAAALDTLPQSTFDPPLVSSNPGESQSSQARLPSAQPSSVAIERGTGGIPQTGALPRGVSADTALPRPGTRSLSGLPSARRIEGTGTGLATSRPRSASGIRRSPILVDRGGVGEFAGPVEGPGSGSSTEGPPGSSGSQAGGLAGIEASGTSGGGRRTPGAAAGTGLAGGPAGGDLGTGFGPEESLGGGSGPGSPGLGSGFAARGSGPARSGVVGGTTMPSARIGRGGFGKSDTTGVPGFVDGEEEGPVPGTLAGSARGGSDPGGLPEPAPVATGRSSARSRPSAALPGALPGPGEPGGIGASGSGLATNLGTPSPRARRESPNTNPGGGRFILDRSSTGVAIDGRPNPAPAYRQRGLAGRGRIAEGLGGNAESERAVEFGLQFLAKHQAADGHWGLHDFASGRPGYENAGEATMEADTAGTGLALLAFLGAGYSHYDDPHRQVVAAGINYLVRNQKLNGDLFSGGSANVWFYSHGIAAIALCEAYGMTRDESLRLPAQKAIDFIVASQHPTLGGWRYAPLQSSDTSVSGWQMMAMKSGELAGLRVPKSAYDGVAKWLDSAQAPTDPSKYSYRPTSQFAHQREPSNAMTAEALLMRLYLGWDRSTPSLVQGADYLQQNLPQYGRRDNPMRDAYYWYYATQVMFQMQGEHWRSWNGQLRPLLVESQIQEGPFTGSWDPKGTVPDRWGDAGGRLYVTTMHLLMLEVYYRHLPLYQTLTETPSE